MNGQTRLLYKVTGANLGLTRAVRTQAKAKRLDRVAMPCENIQTKTSSPKPVRLPKSGSKFRASGRSQTIHTPSFLSPPFGPAAFYLKSVAPGEISLGEIFSSLLPFILIQICAVGILVAFPAITGH